MKLEVPYYSQFKNVAREEFKPNGSGKACAAACLKMALEFIKRERAPTIDELFDEALIIQEDMLRKGLITENSIARGLPHDIIVFVAHNHGVPAYKEEFKSVSVDLKEKSFSFNPDGEKMREFGISKIIKTLKEEGLSIASVAPNFSTNRESHLVLLTGFEEKNGELTGFYYHNPDDRGGESKGLFVDMGDFREKWRKMAIFFPSLKA